jgi:hypothetical protein
MANLLESSQSQATVAPDFYNNYLSNLAGAGKTAATGAQYVGAQPLQEKAFQEVGNLPSTYQPTLQAAGQTLGTAAGSASPLSAATPYLQTAGRDPSQLASQYMSPYITNVVNALGDAGQRNIQQNLAPNATAGAVGSGQFGSQRGAQVLGQTMSNAERDILNQQYQALNTGYNTALGAAGQQNALQAQIGSTAAQAAGTGQTNLTQLGKTQSELAAQQQGLSLADINALSTLGGQQQTIAQNQQLFPLNNLSTLSSLLRGYSIPTTTKTTMQASPLSVVGGAITGTANLFTPRYDANGKEIPNSIPFKQITSGLGSAYDYLKDTLKGTRSSPVTPGSTGSVGNGGEGFSIIADGYGGYVDTSGNPVDQYGMPIAAVPPSGPDTNIDQFQGP